MDAYFSHSYRDVPINTYFSGLFTKAGITLQADKKSDVWCVAKLERYLFEMDGFVSIIPRRIAADGAIAYSPYIGRELMLARRSRGPRILFVDGLVLEQHRSAFPSWAVPFFHEDPGTEVASHFAKIQEFRTTLAREHGRVRRKYEKKLATIVCGKEIVLRDAASHVAAILRDKDYEATVKYASSMDDAFDNIAVFESMLNSEVCVFVLGTDLSYSDLYLAMAHAHCIPSVRLRYDVGTTSTDPELSGVVRWTSSTDLKPQFLKLFDNYQSVFEQPATKGDLVRVGTPDSEGGEWDPNDGPGLVTHVQPENSYVSDRVTGIMREVESSERSRTQSDRVCRAIYDRIKQDRFYYTFEPVISRPTVQKIRTPLELGASYCGTCLDFACLFAALLEAARERPVVVVVHTPAGAHAVTGYLAPDAVTWDGTPRMGDLRAALNRGELILFETTGAVEVREGTVAAETQAERKEGGLMLDYQTAKAAARRVLTDSTTELRHVVDVRRVREGRA